MARRFAVGSLLLVVLWLVAANGRARPSMASAPGQIVQPGDVATPTPTYVIILVPTPTPMRTPDAPESAASLSKGPSSEGFHRIETFVEFEVRPGDTLLTVALEVGLDVTQMPCAVAPDFKSSQPLVIGDVLEVPPPSWTCHLVGADESLTQIAATYGLDPIEILEIPWNALDANALGERTLQPGTYLRIPPTLENESAGGFLNFMLDQPLTVSPMTAYAIGGTRPRTTQMVGPVPKDWPYGSGNFMWPVYGWMSQGYRGDHRAIDIAAPNGTFVTASDRGVVMRAGWNEQGYGTFVIIDHNIDYITLYAHLTEVFVQEGDVVAQGQILGTIGSSGNSTGPHLHFEIRDFGRRANPLDFLIR